MALRINTQLELTTGLLVPTGSHVKVGLIIPKRDSESAIISLGIYKDLESYDSNKEEIMNVVGLPLSFFHPQSESVQDAISVHQLAISHLSSHLNISNELIEIVL